MHCETALAYPERTPVRAEKVSESPRTKRKYKGSGVQPIENFFFHFRVHKYLSHAGLIVEKTASSHYQWLLLPRIDPARLCVEEIRSKWLAPIVKPFGRHFSFFGCKR